MTEFYTQIENISQNIKNIYGENYSEQFIQSVHNITTDENIQDVHSIVDLIDLTINDEHIQKQINNIKKDNKQLKSDISILKTENNQLKVENKQLKCDIDILKTENNQFKAENKQLKSDIEILKTENNQFKAENKQLKSDIDILKNNKERFDALVKLHECNALVNKEFKKLYKLKFKKSKFDYIPNIGDFIMDPPDEIDKDDYDFWLEFNNKYPRSNDSQFREIYRDIASDRADKGAHINVSRLTLAEYDELIKITYPDNYINNKELYDAYRDWIFMFPA